jgi:tetratricopeptide (TPR) repeat protein
MNATITFYITIIIGLLAITGLYFNYKKEKANTQHAKIKLAKRCAIVAAIIIVLNMCGPLVNIILPKEEPATKEDVKLLMDNFADLKSRLPVPTQKEIENEIDKQFSTEFEKKKKIALEEYQNGVGFYDLNNYDKAIKHFTSAIKIFAIPAFYLHRGNSYSLIGRFDQSIIDYSEAIKLNQNYANAYCNRGSAWLGEGDKDKALIDFNKAIQLDPNLAIAYTGRGIVWLRAGRSDKAFDDFNKAIQINPNLAIAYTNRGAAWSKSGDNDKAFNDLNKAIQLNPNLSLAYTNRGIAWLKVGNNEKAFNDFNKAINLDPKLAIAYTNRAAAWLKIGDNDKAFNDCTRAIKLDNNLADAYFNRGIVYFRQQKNKLACRDVEKACELGNCKILETAKSRGDCR